ncbi:anti-sigma-I factor RsgI family protein [Anaerolentibacter hominis]|uniref:anti-sigma-I factor RsgI family protein n=1 Tax=Anaerolentibacter hominis TaxID=3079009 RepID=UPI0031B89907
MKKIEQRLSNAVSRLPRTDVKELENIPVIKMKEPDAYTRQEPPARLSRPLIYRTAAAFCCLLICIMAGAWISSYRIAAATVSLDVNPSIEMTLNKKGTLLSLKAVNSDADAVVRGIRYKGRTADAVICDILDRLVEQGYLKEETNALLLTVKEKKEKSANELVFLLDQKIQGYLAQKNIAPQVVSQVITPEKEASKIAADYGITEGKLALIRRIMDKNPAYTLEELAGRNINDLLLLLNDDETIPVTSPVTPPPNDEKPSVPSDRDSDRGNEEEDDRDEKDDHDGREKPDDKEEPDDKDDSDDREEPDDKDDSDDNDDSDDRDDSDGEDDSNGEGDSDGEDDSNGEGDSDGENDSDGEDDSDDKDDVVNDKNENEGEDAEDETEPDESEE